MVSALGGPASHEQMRVPGPNELIGASTDPRAQPVHQVPSARQVVAAVAQSGLLTGGGGRGVDGKGWRGRSGRGCWG